VSQQDHLSTNVHYQTYIYDNVELNYPLINHNSQNQTHYFKYDETGTGKHFRGFPPGGLNRPTQGTLIRYQINKNRLKRFFTSKEHSLHQISLDSKSIVKTYNFNTIKIRNTSLNDINGDIWTFCDNNFAYCISNADFQSKTRSLFLSSDTLFIKVDGIRNSIWAIEKEKIILKDYYGAELLNKDLPLEISNVLDCLIVPNTGEIFILATLSASGTILISYLKNRSDGDSSSLSSSSGDDLYYVVSDIDSISDWGINNVLCVSGDGWVKKYTNGVLTNLFSLSISCNYISSNANGYIYILDRSLSVLNKINSVGTLIWSMSLPVVSRPETMKIAGNFDGSCIWVYSYDTCSIILDNGYSARLENDIRIGGIGSIWGCCEKQLVLPHAWIKNERL